MIVEALNCPNCGAGIASDSTRCEFCKTRLKTMACPTCFGLMFVGSKFCDHCGAIAAPVEIGLEDDAGDCPRCRVDLENLKIGETCIRACTKCDGLWVDVATFELICADRERQSAVLGFLAERTMKPGQLTKIAYVPCPDCGELMNRNNFAAASGVIVDICKRHGVWFDADELSLIVEFIRKGGMEISRQREKQEIENQRVRLREDERKLGLNNQRFEIENVFGRDDAGIKQFMSRLFD